jgi:N-ethylmaleimide reductase
MTTSLFSPAQIGDIAVRNRIFMAPLTRCRATPGTLAPRTLNATYYAQRAGAGLIVSEATQIMPEGMGYMNTPGIYSAEQEAGWRLVTDAVHAAGGRIVAQLWHVGAISHPDLQPGGALPVSASAFNPGGFVHTPGGRKERVTARALERHEIDSVVAAYRHAAQVAQRAGFDGVEIHGANGYLLEQFLRDSINKRTDDYGGPIENRMKLMLQAVDAAIEVFGRSRVGIRLSPVSSGNGSPADSNPQTTYGAVIDALADRRIAFVHLIEGITGGERKLEGFDFAGIKSRFPGAVVANNKYTREMALEAVATGRVDAVAFGVPFISNPDLPRRLELGAALNAANPATFYGPDEIGYTDYPFLDSSIPA